MNWTVNLIALFYCVLKMPETNGSKSKPEGRGHTAEVWKYFTLSDDKTKTSCNLCHTSLAYSGRGTLSMRNHLNRVHKKNVNSVQDETSIKRQSSLIAWQKSKCALGQGKYVSINRSLAVMCCVDMRPLSIVKGRGFKEFCRQLNPQYAVPEDMTVSNYVKIVYDEAKEAVVGHVSGSTAAITTDLWTSLGGVEVF